MFLHGGLMHVVGNMWMLWIFGDNVEDWFGHGAFALFYLFCGVASGLIHLFFNWGSPLPTIGASGSKVFGEVITVFVQHLSHGAFLLSPGVPLSPGVSLLPCCEP
jgi:hypothetical protein